MAVIKCKMCGGDLEIVEGMTVAECEYCGSKQTIPTVDNEKKLTLFSRANRLRFACEFDKAAGVYEALVADFPEEAEAYWGLVLCKYGIEYVDDPATGKKIPTCHRSSFESVMDDSNLEQALENADAAARKLYREEAKQIEELRKGIIEVSGREDPYDIFICYKETDETGDRTLDSVLAQDVYDALTSRGYRVFFSRITLEDKLGQEYEPYIFAALNSAKIMLAFGTDYEYFNAVWVKNEWSRYLQIMTQDKSRHLIPCYKGIDAYDMPKEFAKLQAQDMGKIGAIQDLLRGIEKLLPKKVENPQVVQQVVQQVVGSGGPNVQALLDRGNMALEDQEWQRADGFFDQALNMNARCADAYLGKALVEFRVVGLQALVGKLDASRTTADSITLTAGHPDREKENKIVANYLLLPYLKEQEIQKALAFSFGYPSQTSNWEKKLQEMTDRLNRNRNLSRAIQYAQGGQKTKFESAVAQILNSYAQKVREAKAADEAAVKEIQEAYARHLRELKALKDLRFQAEQTRESDYNFAMQKFQQRDYAEAKRYFQKMGQTEYRDSQEMIGVCDQKIAEKRAAENAESERKAGEVKAEAERREAIRKKEEAARAAKRKKITIIAVTVCTAVIAIFLLVTKVIIPGNQYKEAEALLAAGQYEEAITAFQAMGNYKNSTDRVYEAKYAKADALLAAKQFDEAIALYTELGSQEDVQLTNYVKAEFLLAFGDKAHAAMAFAAAKGYSDAWARSLELWNGIVQRETLTTIANITVAVKSDGTFLHAGKSLGNISNWNNIAEVAIGGASIVGLRPDGTVVAVGAQSQISSQWKDIVDISAHNIIAGLRADGTVVAAGKNYDGRCEVADWTDIVAIATGSNTTVGLRADGTVVSTSYSGTGDWTDIVAIAAGDGHIVGLQSDGTVVAEGDNYYGQCDVSDWTDIVAIASGYYHTVGLRSDGTVVARGLNGGWCDVSDWTDIVAITASERCTMGLRSDGTVVVAAHFLDYYGEDYEGQYDVSDWTDIKLHNT